MSILKSVLFGCEGSYQIFGTSMNFTKEAPMDTSFSEWNDTGFISRIALKCINSTAFHWISFGRTHLFAHEVSHAVAYKLVTGQNARLDFFTIPYPGGRAEYPSETVEIPAWKETLIDLAGPMGNIAFSSGQLVVATALKNYLSRPVSLILGGGAIIWMVGELFYAYISASQKNDTDFGDIAYRGNAHLAVASTVLITQCALGIFAAIKFAA